MVHAHKGSVLSLECAIVAHREARQPLQRAALHVIADVAREAHALDVTHVASNEGEGISAVAVTIGKREAQALDARAQEQLGAGRREKVALEELPGTRAEVVLRGKDAGGLVCFDGILVASVAHDGRRVARNGKLERGLLRRANQVCEHVRVGPAVCVKEHQVAATCTGHTQVKRSRQATAVSLHQRNGEVSLRHVVNNARRSIRRAVIDHDGLMASQRLVLDALEGTTYRGSVIARGDNNRDNRLPVHGARHNLARLSSPKTVPVGCLTAPTNC